MIEGQPTPVLLYADDAVLIARTPAALCKLINGFVLFMERLDLRSNYSKSKIMSCGLGNYKLPAIRVGDSLL